MKWICAQIGAREHYAIPRVLERAGNLDTLYTDFWATAGWRTVGKLAGKSSLGTRYHRDLADARIVSFNLGSLRASFARKRSANSYDEFLQTGRNFGRGVVRQMILKERDAAHETIFFGYDTGFLEPARWLKARGGKTIVCQMDPSRTEFDLVKEEEEHWPGWAKRTVEIPEAYFRRREEEWAVADLVMVNSEWTKAALISQGMSNDRIVVVPLAYEVEKVDAEKIRGEGFHAGFNRQEPVHVLFLGQVILRKGIQYLIEAARKLSKEPVHFDVVGSIGISDAALASAPANMTFHGPVSRDRTEEFYRLADLFVLPTLSDGFAITQLEAMAYGLPVITTPNCGEVVTDGVDGKIVPPRDPAALGEALLSLIGNREKLAVMASSARAKAGQSNFSRLAENLSAVEKILNAKGKERDAAKF